MSNPGQLVLHRGARPVALGELNAVKAPEPSGRWFPLAHGAVLGRVKETLAEAGYELRREQLALSREDARFFGVLDLGTPLAAGVTLSVGVRNSIDKSFPLGFCAGSRVFCCDNLAFSAELLVRRKHTRHGEAHFAADIAAAIVRLGQYRQDEARRIAAMRHAQLSANQADSLILRAFEKGIVTTADLPRLLREWREPSVADFTGDASCWALFNAFTLVLGAKARNNPYRHATLTMRLCAHLTPLSTAA